MTWTNNYIYSFIWDVITPLSPDFNSGLTCWGQVLHIYIYMCVSKLTIIGSDNGSGLTRWQCWNIFNWTFRNKLQWNLNQNSYIFIKKKWKWKCHLHNGGHFVSASITVEAGAWMSPQQISIDYNLTHLPWTKWPPFWQATFSNASSWMKMIKFRFKFHWKLFPGVQLTIHQHWFR